MRLAFASGTVVGLLAPAVGFFLVQRRLRVGGAAGVEWLRGRRKAAGDQALALLFYTGIAAGVVLVSAAGELNANLFAYLFGSILTVTRSDVVVVVCLGLAGLVVIGVLYRSLVAAALDEDAARVSGVPVAQLNVFLAALAGVTIAVSMRIVGILLIAALMVLPVTAASRVAWSIRSTMLLSMAIGVASVLAGLTISYYANLAPGGAIVLVAASAFVLASLGEALSS